MSLFGALIGTLVETVTLPIAVAKDVLTLGNVANHLDEDCYTKQKLEQIKREASS